MRSFAPRRAIAILLACLAGAMARPPASPAPQTSYFTIATGSSAGADFPVGATIATLLSHPSGAVRCQTASACGPEGLIAVAVASPGSVSNVRDVARARADSALAPGDVVAWAYDGTELFKHDAPMTTLRAIARLYPEPVQLVVLRGAGITTLGDLKHKRVAIDVAGSGTYVEAQRVLGAAHLSARSVDLVQADVEHSATLLSQKRIDAFFFVGSAPDDAIYALANSGLASLVPIDGAAADALTKGARYLAPAVIPDGTYPGVGRIDTIAVSALWIVNAAADPDLVYALTSALWDPSNRIFFQRGRGPAQQMSLDRALDGVPVPLHPGARRYYVEKGMIVPQADAKGASAREALAAKPH